MPSVVRVYTVPGCIDCGAVKALLRQAGIPFDEVDVEEVPQARRALAYLSGVESLPQVFIGDRYIGQVSEVRYLLRTGRMQALLEDVNSAAKAPQGEGGSLSVKASQGEDDGRGGGDGEE